jgi:hypothetical protein
VKRAMRILVITLLVFGLSGMLTAPASDAAMCVGCVNLPHFGPDFPARLAEKHWPESRYPADLGSSIGLIASISPTAPVSEEAADLV